jgi:hypothetical protein
VRWKRRRSSVLLNRTPLAMHPQAGPTKNARLKPFNFLSRPPFVLPPRGTKRRRLFQPPFVCFCFCPSRPLLPISVCYVSDTLLLLLLLRAPLETCRPLPAQISELMRRVMSQMLFSL